MKISLSWIKEHLDTSATLDEISDGLSSLGLVVDGVENPGETLKDFKIAEIVEAGPHPDADRLNLCQVNTGEKIIQVVCGDKRTRKGMKVVLAQPGACIPATGDILKVGKVCGIESFGMMCSASELGFESDSEGILDLPSDAPVGMTYIDYIEGNDPILDVEITPNRGDALGAYGLARDLAAKGLGVLKTLHHPQPKRAGECTLKLTLDDAVKDACPVFAGCLIKGVKNGPSPEWLQRRLRSVGLRPISTLVDITNYFTYDRGRPLHVFDADKVKGGLEIRFAKDGETLKALDEKEYTLDSSMVVIADESGAESLGGIMGGEDTGCDENTTNVFLEAAYFDPIVTAVTGRKLGIISDARYRFERGVDPATIQPGLEAATQMILDLCGGEASEIMQVGESPQVSRVIHFDPTLVLTRGGLNLSHSEIISVLTKLGFVIIEEGSQWRVTTPSWRPDVEGPADLVEEVLRVVGYDHIPSIPFFVSDKLKPLTPLQKRRYEVRDTLASRGMMEVVTWSFLSAKDAEMFGGAQEQLTLINPISTEMAVMRPSILPNLLDGVVQNLNRSQKNVLLFEVGPQYENNTPHGQRLMASGVLYGDADMPSWNQGARAFDYFDALAHVEAVLNASGVSRYQIEANAPAWYHPGRSATIKQGKMVLATLGELHPKVAKTFGLKKRPVAFEVFLDRIPAPKDKVKKSEIQLSNLQPVEKDLAFIVEKTVAFEDIMKSAKKAAGPLIEHIGLFDVFEGESLGDGKKSFAIRLLWQPLQKTLTDEDIAGLMQSVIDQVAKDHGGVLRG